MDASGHVEQEEVGPSVVVLVPDERHRGRVRGRCDVRRGEERPVAPAVGHYSIADIHLFRLYWRFRNAFNPALGEYPNLSAHYARMMARPAVARTFEVEAAIGYELPA